MNVEFVKCDERVLAYLRNRVAQMRELKALEDVAFSCGDLHQAIYTFEASQLITETQARVLHRVVDDSTAQCVRVLHKETA